MANELKVLLSTNKVPRIIFIYGAEEFLIEQALNSILNKFYPNRNSDYNFNKFHSDDIDLVNLLDYCNSYSLLSDENIVLIKSFESYFKGRAKKNDPVLNRLVSYINDPSDTTVLIITCLNEDLVKGKAKVSAEPYKSLLANAFCVAYPKVYPNQFNQWIKDEFAGKGKLISDKGVYLILSQTQQNLRDIYNQIEKIDSYFIGVKNIPDEEIIAIVGQSREYNVFELQKAISRRNIHNSLDICNNIMNTSDDSIKIIAILFNFFKNLLKYYEVSRKSLSKYDIAKSLGINPFFIEDYSIAANQFGMFEVEDIFLILQKYDRIFKTSSPNQNVMMTELIYKIVGVK